MLFAFAFWARTSGLLPCQQDSLPAVLHQRSITPVLLHGRVFAESIIKNSDLRFGGTGVCHGSSGGCYSTSDEKQERCGTEKCRGSHLPVRKRMKDLTYCFSKPDVEQIAVEAWMPDHRVSYRRDLFRRSQAWQVKESQHRLCYAIGYRQHQVCRFEHSDCGEEIGQVDSHTTLRPASPSERSIRFCWCGWVSTEIWRKLRYSFILRGSLPRLSLRPKMQRKTSSKSRLDAKR